MADVVGLSVAEADTGMQQENAAGTYVRNRRAWRQSGEVFHAERFVVAVLYV